MASSSPQPVLAVGAVVLVDDRILLVTRANPPAKGFWTVPGGRVEPGESMAEAVEREVGEETGLEVVCGSLVGWVERMIPGFHYVIFNFRATPVKAVADRSKPFPELVAGDDAGEARWVEIDELGEVDLVPGLLDFLHRYDVVAPR